MHHKNVQRNNSKDVRVLLTTLIEFIWAIGDYFYENKKLPEPDVLWMVEKVLERSLDLAVKDELSTEENAELARIANLMDSIERDSIEEAAKKVVKTIDKWLEIKDGKRELDVLINDDEIKGEDRLRFKILTSETNNANTLLDNLLADANAQLDELLNEEALTIKPREIIQEDHIPLDEDDKQQAALKNQMGEKSQALTQQSQRNDKKEEVKQKPRIKKEKKDVKQKKRQYNPLAARQIFQLTLQEVEQAIGLNPIIIDIPIPESGFIGARAEGNTILARVFISEDVAHVVYYPGVDPGKKDVQYMDIPLDEIVRTVDVELVRRAELNGLKIKKHITVGVYAKTMFNENHFVAISEIEGKLTVINPKGITAEMTNPDMEYIKKSLPEVSDKPVAVSIQDANDVSGCGYFVAAIHKETVRKDATVKDIMDIKREDACRAYDKIPVSTTNEVKGNTTSILQNLDLGNKNDEDLISDEWNFVDEEVEGDKNVKTQGQKERLLLGSERLLQASSDNDNDLPEETQVEGVRSIIKKKEPKPGFFKRHPWVRDVLIGAGIGLVVVGAIAITAVTYGGALPVVLGTGAAVGTAFGLGGAVATGVGLGAIGAGCVAAFSAIAGFVGAITRKVSDKISAVKGSKSCFDSSFVKPLKKDRTDRTDRKNNVKTSLAQQSIFKKKLNQQEIEDINKVIFFLKENIDFFAAPFQDQQKFSLWASKNEEALELSNDLMSALKINKSLIENKPPLIQYQEAILGEYGKNDGLINENDTRIKILLEKNTMLRSALKKHMKNPAIDAWYKDNNIKHSVILAKKF